MKKIIFALLMCVLTMALVSCDMLASVCDHQWAKATCENAKTCEKCGKTSGEPLEHAYDEEIVTEATCEEEGLKRFVCGECDYSYSESYELKTLSATEVHEQYKQSVGEIKTCDKAGNALALGTCFVYGSDGRVVTNYHVIEDAYSATVTLDGEKYSVQKVLAYDKDVDLAVLKINATDLHEMLICTKDHEVGATVYAFGSSQGLTDTFSQGIITYCNRTIDGVSYTQHDAAISSGNSGGPLVNEYGEVIGINTWTVQDSQNLNFAIAPTQLNDLVYGKALTMAEFYEKECDVYVKLKNYIIEKGTYDYENNSYVLTLGTTYSSDYSSKYTRRAYYYEDTENITLDFLIDDGDYWAWFSFNEVDGIYNWDYFDYNDNEMGGVLYAGTFNDNTLLGYNDHNIYYATTVESVRELASMMMSVLFGYITSDFEDIGVTAQDLGFYYY